MAYIKYKYALMLYNYRLKHKRMTGGLPWVKDDDSKTIPAVLQMSKTIQEKDGYKELAESEKDEKYKAWDASKGETAVQEKVGDPLAVKLYKAVVLKQKETRQGVRNIHSDEKSKVITLRNKTVAKGGVKSQWFYDFGLQTWKDIFSDWKEPGTTHELIVRYFSQLLDDFLEVLNTEGADKPKVYALYDRLFLELMDYFIGKTDKVPAVVKSKNLSEVLDQHDWERNVEPKPVKAKPAPPPKEEAPKGRWKKATMLKDKYGWSKGDDVIMDRETKTLYKFYEEFDALQDSDDKWFDSAFDEYFNPHPNLDKPIPKPN